jgi:uncharacterized membrane protein
VPSSAATFLAVALAHRDVADDALASVRALEDEQDVSLKDAAVVVQTTRQALNGYGTVFDAELSSGSDS